jgi:hypothetical protein
MSASDYATESTLALMTKSAPPVSVSIATIAGIQVSDILLWATLIYTVLLIGHRLYVIYKEIAGRSTND